MSRWEIRLAIALISAVFAGGMMSSAQAAPVKAIVEISAIEALATLAVKGRAPKTGYARSEFGQTWADVDRNGCDTRNDTLKRDLIEVLFK
jgi:hypothetical protein